jgi:hypothetical protein
MSIFGEILAKYAHFVAALVEKIYRHTYPHPRHVVSREYPHFLQNFSSPPVAFPHPGH